LKPWHKTTSVTVTAASRREEAGEEVFRGTLSRCQRSFVHQRDLLLQLEDAVLPIALGVEPGERGGEGGIVPAPREPGRVVDEAQRSQGFKQVELAQIEVVEILVARQHVGELQRHRRAVAREQHPQVLDSRARAAVVEVDEVRPLVGPQHVSGVAVPVQAQRAHLSRALVAPGDARERQVDCALPRVEQVRRNEIVGEQPVARLAAQALDVERGPIGERPHRAHRVNAPDKATDPFERLAVFELRRASAAARIHREAKASECVQGPAALERKRRDDRDLAPGELERERVLLENLCVGPARGAIELRDDRGRRARRLFAFEPNLVDAVLVAVQREQPPVAGEAHARKRVEHGIGGEPRVGRFGGHRAIVRAGKRKSARRRTFGEAGRV